jgi:SpoVK/Ycf46/Vps4 family AAA+-type ATPase
MNFDPCLNQLKLPRGEIAIDQPAILDGDRGLLALVSHMDVRQTVSIIVHKVNGHHDAVKHADRRHSDSLSEIPFRVARAARTFATATNHAMEVLRRKRNWVCPQWHYLKRNIIWINRIEVG